MMNLGYLMEALSHNPQGPQREQLHRSLVREVIRMRIADRAKAIKFIRDFMQLHPESTLETDVVDQWNKGNRGLVGDWK